MRSDLIGISEDRPCDKPMRLLAAWLWFFRQILAHRWRASGRRLYRPCSQEEIRYLLWRIDHGKGVTLGLSSLHSLLRVLHRKMSKLSEFYSFFKSNYLIFFIVFVTGNRNKLIEVKAILSAGSTPIDIDSESLDSMQFASFWRDRAVSIHVLDSSTRDTRIYPRSRES